MMIIGLIHESSSRFPYVPKLNERIRAMADRASEVGELYRQLDQFERNYVGGESDQMLADCAKEIFERFAEEMRIARRQNLDTLKQELYRRRIEFEGRVRTIIGSRHAPELEQAYRNHEKKRN